MFFIADIFSALLYCMKVDIPQPLDAAQKLREKSSVDQVVINDIDKYDELRIIIASGFLLPVICLPSGATLRLRETLPSFPPSPFFLSFYNISTVVVLSAHVQFIIIKRAFAQKLF